jgi:hypothetical protein
LKSYAGTKFDDHVSVSDDDLVDVTLSDLSITTAGAVWDIEEADEYRKFIEEAKEAAKEGEKESEMRRRRFFTWLESSGESS